jgi:ferritin
MVSPKLQDALNAQINLELASSYAYLAMAAYFDANSLPGMSSWMRVQSEEERVHAMKIYDHMGDRGGQVVLQSIAAPDHDFESPLAVFQSALHHEQVVTRSINALYALAVAENDYPAQVMLQWFINEQVEEEKNAMTAIDQLKMAAGNPSAILMLDQLFGARTAEPAGGETT